MKQSSYDQAMRSINIEADAVKSVAEYLDKYTFSSAVDTLTKASRIITCASGSSGIAAKKFAHSLCCIERPAQFLLPSEAIHGGLGCVQEGDAVIFVSRGGATSELFPIIDVCVKKNAKIICVTEKLDSPLARKSDIVIKMKIDRESDKLNIMATSSFIATIAIFDALLAALIEETDYTLEQFGLIHPGGAVGQALNK
ncbi:MAG: SIS domain-containing protein [Eubacteriales bacterium]|nr:SIS domain-containing protein [Eubacteriales bacterium]